MTTHPVRKVLWRLLWAALAASAVLVWRYSRQEPDLLSQATRLIARKEDIGRYGWLSTHELLLILDVNSNQMQAVRYDIRTRIQTRLPGLDAALREFHLEFVLVSPNGQWLLCVPFDAGHDAHVVSLDGSLTRLWTVTGSTRMAWFPDSNRWVEMAVPNTGPFLSHLTTAKKQRKEC